MLNHNHKGNEMSMGMIITAVLVLLVLLIMAFLLTGGASNWNKGTDCLNQGGKCAPKEQSCGQGAYADLPLPSVYACAKDSHCCAKAGFGD
jgi:hypothetical protein